MLLRVVLDRAAQHWAPSAIVSETACEAGAADRPGAWLVSSSRGQVGGWFGEGLAQPLSPISRRHPAVAPRLRAGPHPRLPVAT